MIIAHMIYFTVIHHDSITMKLKYLSVDPPERAREYLDH